MLETIFLSSCCVSAGCVAVEYSRRWIGVVPSPLSTKAQVKLFVALTTACNSDKLIETGMTAFSVRVANLCEELRVKILQDQSEGTWPFRRLLRRTLGIDDAIVDMGSDDSYVSGKTDSDEAMDVEGLTCSDQHSSPSKAYTEEIEDRCSQAVMNALTVPRISAMKMLANAATDSPAGTLVRFLRAHHCYRSSRYFIAAIPSFLFARYSTNGATSQQVHALGTLALSAPSVADDLWSSLIRYIWGNATESERAELLHSLCDSILRHMVKHRGVYWLSDFDVATASVKGSNSSAGPVKCVHAPLLRTLLHLDPPPELPSQFVEALSGLSEAYAEILALLEQRHLINHVKTCSVSDPADIAEVLAPPREDGDESQCATLATLHRLLEDLEDKDGAALAVRARYRHFTFDSGEVVASSTTPTQSNGQDRKRYLFSSTPIPPEQASYYSRTDAALSLSLYGHAAEAQAVLLSLIERQHADVQDMRSLEAMDVDMNSPDGGKKQERKATPFDSTIWQRCWLDATKALGQWGQLRMYAYHAQDRYLHLEASAALGDPRGHTLAFKQADPLRGGVKVGRYPFESKLLRDHVFHHGQQTK